MHSLCATSYNKNMCISWASVRKDRDCSSFVCKDRDCSTFVCKDRDCSSFVCKDHDCSRFVCKDRDYSSFVCQDPDHFTIEHHITFITTDLIVTLFIVPPDIFAEPASLIRQLVAALTNFF